MFFFWVKLIKIEKIILNLLENNGIKVKLLVIMLKIIYQIKNLVNLICKSKIVINFTKTTWKKLSNFPEQNIFFNQYQLKGRIIQVWFMWHSLCYRICSTS